jgi:hypothetical protein
VSARCASRPCRRVVSSCGEHGGVAVSRSLAAGTPALTSPSNTARFAVDVVVERGLESGDSHKAAKLATRIEMAHAGGKVSAVEIAESGQGER